MTQSSNAIQRRTEEIAKELAELAPTLPALPLRQLLDAAVTMRVLTSELRRMREQLLERAALAESALAHAVQRYGDNPKTPMGRKVLRYRRREWAQAVAAAGIARSAA